MRHEFSSRTKAQAAIRANGHCECCTRKLLTGDFHYDHEIPDALGGENTLENCRVLCRSCHAVKTKTDVGSIAKANRNFQKSKGIRKVSKWPNGKNSKWKRKVNGQLVLR